MDFLQKINMTDYSYPLPEERIAKFPIPQRDASKLLVFDGNSIEFDTFSQIGAYLPTHSLLIFNNTRVIHARLQFNKPTGAGIEIFCLEPANPSDYQESFASVDTCIWHCFIGNKKKWKNGILSKRCFVSGIETQLEASIVSDTADGIQVRFSWGGLISFADILAAEGSIPLPPYLNRKAEASDAIRYQTVYSEHEGSVAAPTAGLHFTNELLEQLHKTKNLHTEAITLHVGAGTFKPVSVESPWHHNMHREHYRISSNTLNALRNNYGNITITGTTSLRAVESIFWLAQKLYKGIENFETQQWEPYQEKPALNALEALDFLTEYCMKNKFSYIDAATSIMIVPGYEFRYANRLITNFHQPRSTLLLLVAAFTGNRWKEIYDAALNNDFRFLSYGDSSLLFRPNSKNTGH